MIYEETRGVLKSFLESVIRDAVTYTEQYVIPVALHLVLLLTYVVALRERPSHRLMSSTLSNVKAALCTVLAVSLSASRATQCRLFIISWVLEFHGRSRMALGCVAYVTATGLL